jgi:hypothetical protein
LPGSIYSLPQLAAEVLRPFGEWGGPPGPRRTPPSAHSHSVSFFQSPPLPTSHPPYYQRHSPYPTSETLSPCRTMLRRNALCR